MLISSSLLYRNIKLCLRFSSFLSVNRPLNNIFPSLTLMWDIESLYSPQLRYCMFNSNVGIAHQHLSQEVNAMPSMPWLAVLWKLFKSDILSWNNSIVKYPIPVTYAILLVWLGYVFGRSMGDLPNNEVDGTPRAMRRTLLQFCRGKIRHEEERCSPTVHHFQVWAPLQKTYCR